MSAHAFSGDDTERYAGFTKDGESDASARTRAVVAGGDVSGAKKKLESAAEQEESRRKQAEEEAKQRKEEQEAKRKQIEEEEEAAARQKAAVALFTPQQTRLHIIHDAQLLIILIRCASGARGMRQLLCFIPCMRTCAS